jgi:hypothetical protein
MKIAQRPNGPRDYAEILLSMLAVLVAVAVVLFPSYSGLYGATTRAEQGSPAVQRSGFKQADQLPRRVSLSARSFLPPINSSRRG